MNQLEFQAQVMKLCWEMAEMGRNSQIPFDDLERIADRRAWQLTSNHAIYVGISVWRQTAEIAGCHLKR